MSLNFAFAYTYTSDNAPTRPRRALKIYIYICFSSLPVSLLIPALRGLSQNLELKPGLKTGTANFKPLTPE